MERTGSFHGLTSMGVPVFTFSYNSSMSSSFTAMHLRVRSKSRCWVIREALWRLEEDDRFFVAKINLEIIKNEKDPLEVVRVIVEELQKAEVLKNENIRSFNQFSSLFENDRLEKPLILILDEFDSLDSSVISDLVAVFRNIFIGRTEDKADADSGVV